MNSRATRISVGLDDARVLGFHALSHRKQVGDAAHTAAYQIPTTTNRKAHFDCELAKGESLMISLGLHDQPGNLPEVASLANGILASVGLPRYAAPPVTLERLVIIRAEPIDPENKERPGRGKVKVNW
jgi:hypothetical protein